MIEFATVLLRNEEISVPIFFDSVYVVSSFISFDDGHICLSVSDGFIWHLKIVNQWIVYIRVDVFKGKSRSWINSCIVIRCNTFLILNIYNFFVFISNLRCKCELACSWHDN